VIVFDSPSVSEFFGLLPAPSSAAGFLVSSSWFEVGLECPSLLATARLFSFFDFSPESIDESLSLNSCSTRGRQQISGVGGFDPG